MQAKAYLSRQSRQGMSSVIKCITWNVNGIRTRRDRVSALLEAHQPDVVCLQEVKCTQEKYPLDSFLRSGYESAVFGQPAYNGVAILSRQRATDVATGLDDQARAIAGTVHGIRWVNVYVPNGGTVGSPKYAYKLGWLEQLEVFLMTQLALGDDLVVMGDFNVIVDNLDTAHPAAWEGSVLCDPETRMLLSRIMKRFGLVDVLRKHAPGPGVYTWWDYRTRAFGRNDGVRIDHILMTPGLAARSVNAWVDVDERGCDRPSDHAPVLARLLTNGHPAT